MNISILISLLPLEIKHLIGQYLGLYFPYDLDSAKAIINHKNYFRYEEHALKRDNLEQFKIILGVLDNFSTRGMIISDIIGVKEHIYCLTLLTVIFQAMTCLNYLTENGYNKHSSATLYAARCGYLKFLIYLTKNGFTKDPDAIVQAVKHGHLDCLKYLNENGYYRDCHAISCAVENKNIACLQYLIQNNYYIWDCDREYLRANNLIEF